VFLLTLTRMVNERLRFSGLAEQADLFNDFNGLAGMKAESAVQHGAPLLSQIETSAAVNLNA
jgi:hypothetical protein